MFTRINKGLYTCRGQNSRYVLTYGNINSNTMRPWSDWRLNCLEHGVSFCIAEFITDANDEPNECVTRYRSYNPNKEDFVGKTIHEILARAAEIVKNYEYADKVETYL